MAERVALEPIDAVEVTVVVDNSIDILAAPSELALRPPLRWDWSEGDQLRAEHGYSLAVTITRAGSTQRLLHDAGLSRNTAISNLDTLGIDPKDMRAMVRSHGPAPRALPVLRGDRRVRGTAPWPPCPWGRCPVCGGC